MKKYIIGMFFGFALAFTMSAHASDIGSLIGKAIQGEFPVTVDSVKLDKNAVIIDGTSYLPVRAIGNATGYDITFDADLGITLKKLKVATPMASTTSTATSETTVTETPAATPTPKAITVDTQIRELDDQISRTNQSITFNENLIALEKQNGGENVDGIAKWTADIDKFKSQLADLQQRKAALQPIPTPTP